MHTQLQNKRIELINDFAKAKQKFGIDWKNISAEADTKIDNIKHRVVEEYKTNRLDAVKNYWNGYFDDINKARYSDSFIESYLQGNNEHGVSSPIKTEDVNDAMQGCDSNIAVESDKFLQSYLDQGKIKEDVFESRTKVLNDAKESDVLLEKYLLDSVYWDKQYNKTFFGF